MWQGGGRPPHTSAYLMRDDRVGGDIHPSRQQFNFHPCVDVSRWLQGAQTRGASLLSWNPLSVALHLPHCCCRRTASLIPDVLTAVSTSISLHPGGFEKGSACWMGLRVFVLLPLALFCFFDFVCGRSIGQKKEGIKE